MTAIYEDDMKDRLRLYVEQLNEVWVEEDRLREELARVKSREKEVMADAKYRGWNIPALKLIFGLLKKSRKEGKDKIEEIEAHYERYKQVASDVGILGDVAHDSSSD